MRQRERESRAKRQYVCFFFMVFFFGCGLHAAGPRAKLPRRKSGRRAHSTDYPAQVKMHFGYIFQNGHKWRQKNPASRRRLGAGEKRAQTPTTLRHASLSFRPDTPRNRRKTPWKTNGRSRSRPFRQSARTKASPTSNAGVRTPYGGRGRICGSCANRALRSAR